MPSRTQTRTRAALPNVKMRTIVRCWAWMTTTTRAGAHDAENWITP